MWHLDVVEAGGQSITVGSFEAVAAAAARIIELERYPVSGVFFEVLIETQFGKKDEAFSHLEHTAKRTNRRFVFKWVRH